MPKNYDITISSVPADIPMSSLETGEPAIVTKAPPGHSVPPGSLVVKASREYGFPSLNMWCGDPTGYLVRRLSPGETVTIKGK